MILTKDYAIGHVGKTGGRLLRDIFRACRIDFSGCLDSQHTPFSKSVHYQRPMYALTFRRLPQHELSWAHEVVRWGEPFHPASELLDILPGENELCKMLEGVEISEWLRCEYLLNDAAVFLRKYHEVEIPSSFVPPQKYRLTYDHNIWNFWTTKQIQTLYQRSPTWACIEKQLYGKLVIP